MSHITKAEIFKRIRAAMMPAMQSLTETGKRQKIGGATFESLIQKAQQRRRAKPEIRVSPE